MKKVFWIILTLLVAGGAAFWWLARRDNNMYRLVPKDAHIVMSVSIPAMATEISPELLGRINWMDTVRKELLSKGDTAMFDRIRTLKDAGSNFGVDILSDLVFFTTRYEGLDFRAFVFDIADPAEFRKLINAIDPTVIVDMKANYSVINLNDGLFLAWNKRGGIFVMNDYSYAYARNIIRSNFIVETFSRQEDQSILSLEAYQNSRNDKKLMYVYANMMAMDTAKVRVYEDGDEVLRKRDNILVANQYKDCYMVGGLKHENQALVFDGQFISWTTGLHAETAYAGKGLTEAHAQKLTGMNPMVLLTSGERTAMMDSLFTNPDTKESMQEMLSTMNWTEEECKSLLKAEFSFGFQGITKVPFDPAVDQLPFDRNLIGTDESGNVFMKVPTFNMEVVHADRALLDRSMKKLLDFSTFFKSYDDHVMFSALGFNFHIRPSDLGVTMGNYQANTQQSEAINNPEVRDLVLNGTTKNAVYMYVNLNASRFNDDTKEFLEKYASSMEVSGGVLQQFEYLEVMGGTEGLKLVLKFKDGDAKLFDRVIHLFEAMRNPTVS